MQRISTRSRVSTKDYTELCELKKSPRPHILFHHSQPLLRQGIVSSSSLSLKGEPHSFSCAEKVNDSRGTSLPSLGLFAHTGCPWTAEISRRTWRARVVSILQLFDLKDPYPRHGVRVSGVSCFDGKYMSDLLHLLPRKFILYQHTAFVSSNIVVGFPRCSASSRICLSLPSTLGWPET